VEFSVRPEVKIFYPTVIFGSLTINNRRARRGREQRL
jgi:hypothetical protein